MKTVLITGATAGIGYEMAKQYRAQGWRVLFCGRRLDRLERIERELDPKSIGLAKFFCIDVTHSDEFTQVKHWLAAHEGGLDLVVANAGFSLSGRFEDLNENDYRRQFDVNFYGVMNSIRPFLSELKKSKGQIAIIGSGNSYLAIYGASPYCSSKFAVRAFAECLRMEMAEKGVSVTLVCPGFVDTEIHRVDNSGVFHPEGPHPAAIPKWIQASAQSAAASIMRGISRRKAEVWVTFHVKFAILLELLLKPVSRIIRNRIRA